MRDALKLFEQLEIKHIPCSEIRCRGPMSTCCGKFVQRLIKKHDLPHVTLVLRAIVESEGNAGELISDIIGAVSDVSHAHPRWPNLGLQFIEAFDRISLAEVRVTAKKTAVQPLRLAVATILCLRLEEILGPAVLPKPPKPVRLKPEPKPPLSLTRIPQIERAIALGKDLLSLRASIACNKQFGRERRRRFPDVDSITAARTMRVARLYGDLHKIWRAASWRTLIELASPKMAPSMRQEFEARILAGESITAPHIRKIRGRFKGGSPKRPADQQARMAA